jgi:all-trans-retinol dehydrogenase (NAD+)
VANVNIPLKLGFAESLRIELRKSKKDIQTTLVCPFYINTGMFDGVKSPNPLLPILSPRYVVDSIMTAIRTNQHELYLPGMVKITFLARLIFPAFVRDWILDQLAVTRAMDEFQGQRRV